jgi:hypothetical protein
MTQSSVRRLRPALVGAGLALVLAAPVAAQPRVVLSIDDINIQRNRVDLLPTFPLPAGNTRYGIEYRPGSRSLLARPAEPAVCHSDYSQFNPSGPALYIDPNGIRPGSPLQVVSLGGHPYQPFKFGSEVLSGIALMAYDVDPRQFVVELDGTRPATCSLVTRQPAPLTPEQALCGTPLTDDPKDGWNDNSLLRAGFDEPAGAADLELIPWRDSAAPTTQHRYGYLVRNKGAGTARGVRMREFVAGDALHFQRSLSLEGTWGCRGFGGAFCDAWPNMQFDRGYMTTEVGTIPAGGCLKFEAFRDFTFNFVGTGLSPSGVLAARVLSDDESEASLEDNAARMSF